ncbi:hypothetical protein MW887_008604 [Aspergillus wentii]|nr:hypothetical protein MW887_008604 [Aspergillus wentii]
MTNPIPIRSPLNAAQSNPDYSYTSPLDASGSDYPCKGYANDMFTSVSNYTAGKEYTLSLEGTATHEGGSCQIALSYDQGQSFHVIKSILGDCPLAKNYRFRIPGNAPSGQALLAWTWFNKVGNREMYMDCAQVTVQTDREPGHSQPVSQTAFGDLPPIFLANINKEGQCRTKEGEAVNFPRPGHDVEGSLDSAGYDCTEAAPFRDDQGDSQIHSTSPSAEREATAITRTNRLPCATPIPGHTHEMQSMTTTPPFLPSNRASQNSASSGAIAFNTASSASCVPGSIVCLNDGHSFALCNFGTPVPMGAVAAGSRCTDGAIHAEGEEMRNE